MQDIVAGAVASSNLHEQLLASNFHAHDVDALESRTAVQHSEKEMVWGGNHEEVEVREDEGCARVEVH